MQGLGLLYVMAAAGICAVQRTHIRKQADGFFKNATDTLNKTVREVDGIDDFYGLFQDPLEFGQFPRW